MMQSLGLAALLAPLVVFAWGWRLLRERLLPTRWWWRLAAFPTGLMLLAMALESLPRPQSWPLDNKLGGFVGDRSDEHTSELQSLLRITYAVFCLKKKINEHTSTEQYQTETE